MDSQLWVPVPKLQSSRREPEDQNPKSEKTAENQQKDDKKPILSSAKPKMEQKNPAPQINVNISKLLDQQETLNLGLKISKRRNLEDLIDDDDEFSLPTTHPPPPPDSSSETHSDPNSASSCDTNLDNKSADNTVLESESDPKLDDYNTDEDDSAKRSLSDEETLSQKLEALSQPEPDTHDSKRIKLDSSTNITQPSNSSSNTVNIDTQSHSGSNIVDIDKISHSSELDDTSQLSNTTESDEFYKVDKLDELDKSTESIDDISNLGESSDLGKSVKLGDSVKQEKCVKRDESGDKAKKDKKLDPIVIEDIIEPINRWWEEIDSDMDYNKCLEFESKSRHWQYLEHNGMIFTPEYVPHGVPIKVKGEIVSLSPSVEEIATMWAQSIGTNYETSEIYRKNFWTLFTERFPRDHAIRRCKLADVDFGLIKAHLEAEKEKKKANKEFYKAKQQEEARREYRFNYALVDWVREKVSSNKLEPPGLFKGRGLHPKQGCLKLRMFPKDVILNLSKDAPVPKVANFQRNGHCWKDIYHDNTVTWLAYYRDSINNQFKYMYLSAQSKFKGFHDFLKYNKARELKSYIAKIREDYNSKMLSLDMYERQIGTAIYLIDYLALRVGGEKDADEADTVGCCSLRVEHIKFHEGKKNTITLDFLGKDSIRYFNTVTLSDVAYDNLVKFCHRKKPSAEIFNLINTSRLNDYLKALMDGLSAKVFRTYNASITLQNQFKRIQPKTATKRRSSVDKGNSVDTVNSVEMESSRSNSTIESDLNSIDINTIHTDTTNTDNLGNTVDQDDRGKLADKGDRNINVDLGNIAELLQFYNYANREVAILCNHQRSVPKQHETSMTKLKLQAKMLKEDIQELTEYLKHVQSNSTEPFNFVSKTSDINGNLRKLITKPGMKADSVKKKLSALKKKQKDHVIKMRIKDDNKTVALGTSKINYMDPRITVAFCKRYEIPIEKVFNKSLRMKFPWAMYTKSDFTF